MCPLGGANVLWNESSPAETDVADAGPIRSIETSIRNAMGSEHYWPATGGASTGYHLPGSARPFYDVESNVSSAGTDGRIMVTSDTSRFFHVGSGGTMLLGGQSAMLFGVQPSGGQGYYWAVETGNGSPDSNGSLAVTIPRSGYSGVPEVQVTAEKTAASPTNYRPNSWVQIITATSFVVGAWDDASNSGASRCIVHWLSVGTRVL